MFQRMLASALIAGVAAGLIAALLHFAFVQNLIVLGEGYETGELVHFSAAGPVPAELGADGHDHIAPDATLTLKRNGLTLVFMIALYSAYGFLLVAGFGIAEAFGRKIGALEGLVWGIAGFAVFHLSPSMGLAPELPGTIGPDLTLRQFWWWMTVACTGTGIALLAYGRHWAAFALAGACLAIPHVIGAPELAGYSGKAPTELGALFAARVLGAALVVWACLGWFAGAAWAREGKRV
jgi:cobalt transporter subunit CbtA